MTTFSISKAIIATLVGRSIMQGHLRGLDQTVGEVLPKWRGHSIGKVTVQQLLQHTSGIQKLGRHGSPLPIFWVFKFPS
ncbi:MAG: serine hydrolase [Bacteroidetes bacterium]|nr:serine hydrolase [Bacteroidota bacterium]